MGGVQKCYRWVGVGVIAILNRATKTDLPEKVIKTNLSKTQRHEEDEGVSHMDTREIVPGRTNSQHEA